MILCLIYLLRKKVLSEKLFRLVDDKGFVVLSGYGALILGLVTVILHNLWVADWRVVITILGWISLFKGIARIGFPGALQKLMSVLFKNKLILMQILLVIATFLDAWLIWMSYY